MKEKNKIAIIGGGPTGLALALKLLRRSDPSIEVTVFEEKSHVGGIAGTFEYKGLFFDYGSHRLHTSTSNEIISDLRNLLGNDLLDRPRNGRIRLLGQFVDFPLKPFDLAYHLPPSFIAGFIRDMVRKPFQKRKETHRSFEDALEAGLGRTICRSFYFPYAKKLWGLAPDQIAAVQAHRRVSANTMSKMVQKIAGKIPGLSSSRSNRFYYPMKGIGQICQAMATEIQRLGGQIVLSAPVREIHVHPDKPFSLIIEDKDDTSEKNQKGLNKKQDHDFIFSTIPVTLLVKYLRPSPPKNVLQAASKLDYRGMLLFYVVLNVDQFTPYDAHYFPETDQIFSRLSEPKNYTASSDPKGRTGLCFEIPCDYRDSVWNGSEDEIGSTVLSQMAEIGLPVKAPISDQFIRRLRYAYPVYDLEFESRFQTVDHYLTNESNVVHLGRQGLFAHDNMHHAIEMGYRASDCMNSAGQWQTELWHRYRNQFKKHVVED